MAETPSAALRREPQLPEFDLIGHAGGAASRLRGTPTRRHLEAATRAALLRLEVDVCRTSEGIIVLRHDTEVGPANVVRRDHLLETRSRRGVNARERRLRLRPIPIGTPVVDLSLDDLRRLDPELLTLDEAIDILAGRVPLLFDVKSDLTAQALGRWLSRRRDAGDFAACTESRDALLHLRFAAPRAERWPSFPDVGDQGGEYVRRVCHQLWLAHRHPRHVGRSLAEVGRALGDVRDRPRHGIARIAGLPWRSRLAGLLAERANEVGAAALCIQHWLITPEICSAAQHLGLPVTAWTVNETDVARRVRDCGAERITTDEVKRLRAGLGLASTRVGLAAP